MDVFISYKAEEKNEALWVKTRLESSGFSCWMAPESIPGGTSYAKEITQAIRGCRVFVLILSELCQTSKWVPRELDQAINENKRILPFTVEPCELTDEFSFYLPNVQRYNAYENKEREIRHMINDIKAEVGVGELEKQRKSVEAKPVAYADGAAENTEESKEPEQDNERDDKSVRFKPGTRLYSGYVNEDGEVDFSVAYEYENKIKKIKKRYSHILLSVVLGIIAAVILISVIFSNRKIDIAGQKIGVKSMTVEIADKEITADDINNFAKFKDIYSVEFKNCKINSNDLSAFGGFENLYTASFVNCDISEAQLTSFLLNSKVVYYLDISGNPQITSLDVLEPVKGRLKELTIDGTSVSDISAISGFTALEMFSAEGNNITDISALAACSKLETLCVADNKITDISALSGCEKLEILNIESNLLVSLSGLEDCIYLRTLVAPRNRIENIDGLCNATLLESVDLTDNSVSDISVLKKSAENIKFLYLRNNKIEDISFLNTFKKLYALYLDGNLVSNVDSLAGCSELSSLTLKDNRLMSAGGIEKLKKLEYLNLSGNKLTVFGTSGEFSMVDNAVLDLSRNSIETLGSLGGTDYRYVALYSNNLSDYSFLKTHIAHNMALDYSDKIIPDDMTWDENLPYCSYYILGCPLDRRVEYSEKIYGVKFVTEDEAAELIKENLY